MDAEVGTVGAEVLTMKGEGWEKNLDLMI